MLVMRLSGKTALVTGGASGLGLAIARRFVEEGARVAIFDRSAAALEAASADGALLPIRGDVVSYDDNRRAVQEAIAAFGRLDTFIGNAGIFDQNITLDALPDDGGSAAFDELIGINVRGYLLGAKAAVDAVRAAGGTMIFTASISGLHPAYGGILYVPAKHAIIGLAKRLALELAPHVRVNAVAPGYVPTGLAGTEALGQQPRASRQPPGGDSFLMKRVPQIVDYTGLYVFLASSDSVTMTGQVLVADSGVTLQRA
jgi:NAD(P)-dependent dehydrogenase (short-subunit alcohol dehydrogenase family)